MVIYPSSLLRSLPSKSFAGRARDDGWQRPMAKPITPRIKRNQKMLLIKNRDIPARPKIIQATIIMERMEYILISLPLINTPGIMIRVGRVINMLICGPVIPMGIKCWAMELINTTKEEVLILNMIPRQTMVNLTQKPLLSFMCNNLLPF